MNPSPLRATGRLMRRRSALIDQLLTWAETARTLSTPDPILVFSLGKTGTTALTEVMAEATGRTVMKAHALSRRGTARRLAKERRLAITDRPRFLWATQAIRADLALRRRRCWDIVCGVRDPLALAASDHFYGLQLQAEKGLAPERRLLDPQLHVDSVGAAARALFEEEDWFADELGAITGIDVYQEPFDHRRGWQVYERGRFRVLLLRFEDLPAVGPAAVSSFLGLASPLAIPQRNAGEGTDPASLYGRFLREAVLPADVIDAAYGTRLARHLYSHDERAEFAARWGGVRA